MPSPTVREEGLTIVIPALNEEEAIESTIQRCLAARAPIQQQTGLRRVDIIVVDDGSTDQTHAKASRYEPEIRVLRHEKNLGYGAAIKHGFRESRTTLAGFLDADGTCDPLFFIPLCLKQKEGDYDVVLGSRMGPESEMPAVRRLGNRLYSLLLGLLAQQRITDTASGMRVVKAASLSKIEPLPDGLHYTPAMTSRVLFRPGLTLAEVPMPYAERIGESKLSVVKDGVRFLRIILEMALIYRPLHFFGTAALGLFALCLVYTPGLIHDALVLETIPDDRIYRMLSLITFFVGGLMLLNVGFLGQKMSLYLHNYTSRFLTLYNRILSSLAPLGLAAILVGFLINLAPLREYWSMGKIQHSWIYIAAGALLVLAGLQMLTIGALNFVIDLVIRLRGNDNQEGGRRIEGRPEEGIRRPD
ncbi:MAG: glycosyltransferase family 2 protein [bacterium]